MPYTIPEFGPSDLLDSAVVGERKVKVASSLDDALRQYASLSQPRVLVTTLNQTEVAAVEGDRYSFVKSLSNVDQLTPVYIAMENPIGSGVIAAIQRRTLKTYSGGLITFQVLWDYDISTAVKSPFPLFNENNVFRGVKDAKINVDLLNPSTTPAEGDWDITDSAIIVDQGIEREIDFIPTTGQGSNSVGGVSPEVGFRFYKEGTGALMKIVSSVNDNRVIFGLDWIEVPTDL